MDKIICGDVKILAPSYKLHLNISTQTYDKTRETVIFKMASGLCKLTFKKCDVSLFF